MAAVTPGEAASEALLKRKEELAYAITEALYGEMPELTSKYGAPGRAKCLQDMRYNLEHLAPAVALGEPVLFAHYAAWLRDMLAARGIPVGEVRRSFELTREVVGDRFGRAEALAVAASIDAGLSKLDTPASEGA
jgi:hypothetical protein